MKRIFLMTVPLLVMTGLTACETVEGAGQDISKAGQAIETEAQQAKR